MIGALCESPLTMQAITDWHDALEEGRMLLRDVIDLDATYSGGPDAEGNNTPTNGAAARARLSGRRGAGGRGPAAKMAKMKTTRTKTSAMTTMMMRMTKRSLMSLAAMEQALKPRNPRTFRANFHAYLKLHRAQDKRLIALQRARRFPSPPKRTYERHRKDLLESMELVRLNNARSSI